MEMKQKSWFCFENLDCIYGTGGKCKGGRGPKYGRRSSLGERGKGSGKTEPRETKDKPSFFSQDPIGGENLTAGRRKGKVPPGEKVGVLPRGEPSSRT